MRVRACMRACVRTHIVHVLVYMCVKCVCMRGQTCIHVQEFLRIVLSELPFNALLTTATVKVATGTGKYEYSLLESACSCCGGCSSRSSKRSSNGAGDGFHARAA